MCLRARRPRSSAGSVSHLGFAQRAFFALPCAVAKIVPTNDAERELVRSTYQNRRSNQLTVTAVSADWKTASCARNWRALYFGMKAGV